MGVPGLESIDRWFRQGEAEPLRALDTSFLDAEGPATPLHIGALAVFEGGPLLDADGELRLEELRAEVAGRLHRFPRFRQRVARPPLGAGRPVWVDDEYFDLDHHLRTVRAPAPGDRGALLQVCEELQATPLDLDRPLWELWFVTGLADGTVAMVEKVHHAMVDGVSGVEVAAALLDLDPDATHDAAPPWSPRPAPGPGRLLARSAADAALRPLELARAGAELATRPLEAARRAGAVLDAAATLVGAVALRPRSSLHQAVGANRQLRSVAVPLEEVREAGHALGATVNDMVLAAVTGGIRQLLRSRGEPVDGLTLQVLVPVSVRTDAEHLALGNRVAALIVPLPVGEPSAVCRVRTIANTTAERKHHHGAEHTELLLGGAEWLPAGMIGMIARSIHHQPLVDVVVTNIPGVDAPLWFRGARLLETVPIVPLGGNLTVGIAVLSYDGTLTIGVHADAAACPDVDVLAEGIAHALDELEHLPWAEDHPHAAPVVR